MKYIVALFCLLFAVTSASSNIRRQADELQLPDFGIDIDDLQTIGDDIEIDIPELFLKVQGNSGKMTIGTGKEDKTKMEVAFVALYERDAEGNVLGSGGSNKHSFGSFSTQEFTFGAMTAVTLGDDAVPAVAVSFEADLVGSGKLKITTYVIKGSGQFALNDDETFELAPGNVKFDVEFESWPFCVAENGVDDTLCVNDSGDGAFLDLEIQIKGKNSAEEDQESTNLAFNFGNAVMTLSDSVRVDGNWQKMSDDGSYPKLTTEDSKQTLTLRFPKFETNVMYDPIFDIFGKASGSSSTVPTMLSFVMSALLMVRSMA